MTSIPAGSSSMSNIPLSPAIVQSVYPATTTTVIQPTAVAQPRYAVYDKPADRRLRPWILLGSVLLGVCSFFSTSPSAHPIPHNTHSFSLLYHFSSNTLLTLSPFSAWLQQWSSSHSSMKAESTPSGVCSQQDAFLVVQQSLDSSLDSLCDLEQRHWYVSFSLHSLVLSLLPSSSLVLSLSSITWI